MEEDEQPMASDVEPDSEVEDGDIEQELGLWLGQLQQDSGVGTKKTMPRAAVTPKMAMDSFRHSIMHTGDGDMDLDALLGELCELETQLTSQQTELECHSASLLPPPGGCEDESRESIESQLQNALSELSDITCAPIGEELEALSFTGAGDRNSGLSELSSGGTVSAWDGFSDKSRLDAKTSPNRTPVRPPDNVTMTTNHNTQYTSKTAQNQVMSGVQMDGDGQIVMDTTPEGAEADSGFSDTVSLPSSGSHASVATAGSQGSQNSQSSRGSASSGVGLPPSPTPASQMHDVDEVSGQLQSILSVLSKDNLTSAEQAAKLKAEKVRIALEKIKHANIKKLCVRAYAEDGSSKSILIDESITVGQACDMLVAKNHVLPSITWTVVESLPDLYMERMLEDHDFLVENLLLWPENTNNKVTLLERPEKYNVFRQPEIYLLPHSGETDMSEEGRSQLIQEFFTTSEPHLPEVEGMLYLKSEGKKAWKKLYFVLRASGLYYNPKGKSKSSKDLVCLSRFDFVDVYSGVGWKKKYKAPTDYGFALKHPQIQKKSAKYIKYLCADDQTTMHIWLTGIRIAKHGSQLWLNYQRQQDIITHWGSQDLRTYAVTNCHNNNRFKPEEKPDTNYQDLHGARSYNSQQMALDNYSDQRSCDGMEYDEMDDVDGYRDLYSEQVFDQPMEAPKVSKMVPCLPVNTPITMQLTGKSPMGPRKSTIRRPSREFPSPLAREEMRSATLPRRPSERGIQVSRAHSVRDEGDKRSVTLTRRPSLEATTQRKYSVDSILSPRHNRSTSVDISAPRLEQGPPTDACSPRHTRSISMGCGEYGTSPRKTGSRELRHQLSLPSQHRPSRDMPIPVTAPVITPDSQLEEEEDEPLPPPPEPMALLSDTRRDISAPLGKQPLPAHSLYDSSESCGKTGAVDRRTSPGAGTGLNSSTYDPNIQARPLPPVPPQAEPHSRPTMPAPPKVPPPPPPKKVAQSPKREGSGYDRLPPPTLPKTGTRGARLEGDGALRSPEHEHNREGGPGEPPQHAGYRTVGSPQHVGYGTVGSPQHVGYGTVGSPQHVGYGTVGSPQKVVYGTVESPQHAGYGTVEKPQHGTSDSMRSPQHGHMRSPQQDTARSPPPVAPKSIAMIPSPPQERNGYMKKPLPPVPPPPPTTSPPSSLPEVQECSKAAPPPTPPKPKSPLHAPSPTSPKAEPMYECVTTDQPQTEAMQVPVIQRTPSKKPKPPPPKRNPNTKLSVYEDKQGDGQQFYSDLTRVINQKHAHVSDISSGVCPAAPSNGQAGNYDYLPPPPPELLQGLNNTGSTESPRRKVPPPLPPKRSQQTHLSDPK